MAWIGWNARAHGDPLHFLTRVAAYRVRITNSEAPTWLLYPEAFVRAGPAHAGAGCGRRARGSSSMASLRKRWALPLTSIAALVLFLLEGDLHNGAPTHHPERALLAAFWVGATFGVDGGRSLAVHFVWARPKREAWFVGGATALAVGWGLVWPSRVREYPARSPREDRSEQLARGAQLRERKVAHLTVTPCAYEHFALLAAFEAPERVTLRPSSAAGVNGAGAGRAGDCPEVEEQ